MDNTICSTLFFNWVVSSSWIEKNYFYEGSQIKGAVHDPAGAGYIFLSCPISPEGDPSVAPLRVLRIDYRISQTIDDSLEEIFLLTSDHYGNALWCKTSYVWISIDPEDPEGTIVEVPEPE